MKKYFLIFLLIIIYGCNKPKSVLICGDHVCINSLEAKQYFEKNLSIEVKIIDQEKNNEIDLVQLNLNDNNNKRKISIKKKKKTDKKIKILSNNEIKKIKSDIKKNRNKQKIVKKIKKREETEKSKVSKIKNLESSESILMDKNDVDKFKNKLEVVDICTIIETCSIEEISKYLIEQGKNKDYPNITIREKKL